MYMSTTKNVLTAHEEYLCHLRNKDVKQCLIFELNQLRSTLQAMQQYQERLQCKHETLRYEVSKLQQELCAVKATEIAQPSYDGIKRVRNGVQLRVLSHSVMFDDEKENEQQAEYHLVGQIIKRKLLSTIMFFELLIAPKYLIKIALKKRHFDAVRYHEIKTQCKLGSVIECTGKLEKGPPPQTSEPWRNELILEVEHQIELIQQCAKRGFEPYRETDSVKRKTILCSRFVKHFVSSQDRIPPLNVEFVPKICIRSNCRWRHKLMDESEVGKITERVEVRNQVLRDEADENDPFSDSKNSKVARARLFGQWIVKKYGLHALQTNGVLDIAGGGGDLAAVLSEYRIPVTIIDPRKPNKMHNNMKKKKKKTKKQLAKQNRGNQQEQPEQQAQEMMVPLHLAAYFEWDTLDKHVEIKRLFDKSEVILGLHPDQATEPIVDVALKHNKSFAILPCCVFANLYPKYMDQQPVKTYMQFLDYLRLKNAQIHTDYLAFKGRNKILYFDAH